MTGINYWRERLAALEKRKPYITIEYYNKQSKKYKQKIAIYEAFCCM